MTASRGSVPLGLFVSLLAVAVGCSSRGTVKVGGACTIDESCVTSVCIREAKDSAGKAWMGGYCSGNCGHTACPQGLCLTLADGYSYCASECQSTKDCRSDYVCSTAVGACLPDCRLGWACGSLLTCDQSSGACAVPSIQATEPLGAPCTLNAQCLSGLCIPERKDGTGLGWLGGSCSLDCTNATCPTGALCAHLENGSAYCATACSAVSACREGYVCSPALNACLPDCRLGWSCGSSLTCDTAAGACDVPKLPPGPVGAICTLNVECQGALCIPATGSRGATGWSNGYCTQDCAASICPTGTTCMAFLDGNSRCLASCASSSACRIGFVCDTDEGGCLPDCRLGWSCGTMLTCNASTGICVTKFLPDGGVSPDASSPTNPRDGVGGPGPGPGGTGGSGGGGPGPGGPGGPP